MQVLPILTGAFGEICYLLWNNQKQTLIVDPGDDSKKILQAIEEHQLNILAYLCTHGHTDHINALRDLHAKYPAPIAIHSADLAWAFEPVNQFQPYYGVPPRPEDATLLSMDSKSEWNFGDITFQCIKTPGHTPGSCCLHFPESHILISGDTLFQGGCGRTDLNGGNPQQLKESLNRLMQLPTGTQVYPGHGSSTTIGTECARNVYMR